MKSFFINEDIHCGGFKAWVDYDFL